MKLFKKSLHAAFSLFCLISASIAQPQTLVELSDPNNPSATIYASGINDTGQVVGSSEVDEGGQAIMYYNGTVTDLGTLPGYTESGASAINSSGQIVGGAQGDNGSQSFLYSGGIITALPTTLNAVGINNSGQIAGDHNLSGSQQYGFLYSNGIVTDIQAFSNASYTTANSINNLGQVVGDSYAANGIHAYLYSNGTVTDLGPGDAFSINNSGEVVGSAAGSSNGGSFLYINGVRTDLGTLGGIGGQANDINNLGEVVGYSATPTVSSAAYVYTSGTGMQNLNTLYASLLVSDEDTQSGFVSLDVAKSVNDSGEIIGEGEYWNGTTVTHESYLLDPITIPEPNAILLSGAGLGLLIVWRKAGLLRSKRA